MLFIFLLAGFDYLTCVGLFGFAMSTEERNTKQEHAQHMLLLVTALRLLDVAAVVFTAAGCVSVFVAGGDDGVGLDVGHDAVMPLTILM